MDARPAIAIEVYRTLEALGADSELLSIIGSWGDTRDEKWVLEQLQRYNERKGKPAAS